MKGSTFKLIFLVLIAGLVLSACGTSKKIAAPDAKVDELVKENGMLKSQLAANSNEINTLKAENADLVANNLFLNKEFKELFIESNITIAEQASRLKNLQNVLILQKTSALYLKSAMADALMNYKTEDLYVYTKDGNVYVSLEDNLVFKSGSDVVDAKGKEALKTLANVINSTNDIVVMIEGHTDNTQIDPRFFIDDWDLSTSRANAIVRILTNENGVDPARISVSGKGKYKPIKPNDTVEGRASNRRIEVILTPDLKELFRLLYQ
jgi:chemotaxis protein MotB